MSDSISTSSPSRHHQVIVIGGGQTGLSISYYLGQRGIDHVVFEKNRVGHAWREKRWDSFCLVTPNWQCQLPGHPYSGDDPHGFMAKDDIVRYIEGFAAAFSPPLREGVAVEKVSQNRRGTFEVQTSEGTYSGNQVVVAVGSYHVPKVPRAAERLPGDIVQLHASQYRNPEALPDGAVLVVGTGQSGCQIAEDLHLAGRQVHLCVGGAPRVSRRYRGRDVVDWLDDMGHYDIPVENHLSQEEIKKKANHYVTGRDGGRDIDLRAFAQQGMRLYGRLRNITERQLTLGDDLERNLDHADATNARIKASIDDYIRKAGIDAPEEPPYIAPWRPSEVRDTLDYRQAGIGSVIWCIGYDPDFSWIEVPVFDGSGYPRHARGVTGTPGLYFIGLPWLHTWGSGRFYGVARDAEYIAARIDSQASAHEMPLSAAR